MRERGHLEALLLCFCELKAIQNVELITAIHDSATSVIFYYDLVVHSHREVR